MRALSVGILPLQLGTICFSRRSRFQCVSASNYQRCKKMQGNILRRTTSCCGSRVAPARPVPCYECVLLVLWRPRLWSCMRAQRVKTGAAGLQRDQVSVQPCGPLNIPLMPTVRFQPWVLCLQLSWGKHHLSEIFTGVATRNHCITFFFQCAVYS